MEKRGLKIGWLILLLVVGGITFFFLWHPPGITGGIVYEKISLEKNWTFDRPGEFLYNNTLINFSRQEVKLAPQTLVNIQTASETIPVSLLSAILFHSGRDDDNDTNDDGNLDHKTAELESLDGNFASLNKENSLLDLTFNSSLNNGDNISFYLLEKKNTQTNLFLCDQGRFCSSPGYGQINFSGQAGWYNLTLGGLSAPQTSLALDPPQPVKVDFVLAHHQQVIRLEYPYTIYPSSAEIETLDFQPPDLANWQTFSPTEELNHQKIEFQYSTDAGVSWTGFPENGDLSSVNSSKIRIKAILTSNGTATPILRNLHLIYAVKSCPENWSLNLTGCNVNDTKAKQYFDQNGCGTFNQIPSDQGTKVSCDYCTPDWQETNSSCQPSNLFTRSYLDANDCYFQTRLENDNNSPPSQNYSCNYCTLNNCTSSFRQSFLGEGWIMIKTGNSSLDLEVTTLQNSAQGEILVIEYAHNLKNNSPTASSLNKYFVIESNISHLSSIKMIINYTDEEIQKAGLAEESLKIHYYNESRGLWEELESVVNATGNYVSALVSHLSFYGLFGQEKATPPPAESPPPINYGGGGGGSSSRGKIPPAEGRKETTETLTEIEPLQSGITTLPPASLLPEKSCDYVLEISLPGTISLLKDPSFEGEVINKGNCPLPQINFYLSPSLHSLVSFSPPAMENLEEGNRSKFWIIRRSESWFSLITGLTIVDRIISQEVEGLVIAEVVGGEEPPLTKELPVKVVIFSPKRIADTFQATALGMGFLVILLILLGAKLWKRKVGKRP